MVDGQFIARSLRGQACRPFGCYSQRRASYRECTRYPGGLTAQVLCGPEEVRVECLAEAIGPPPRYQETKRPES
jgi:hypothetical protein